MLSTAALTAATTAGCNAVARDLTRLVTYSQSSDFTSIRRRNSVFLFSPSSRRVAPVVAAVTAHQPNGLAVGMKEKEKSLADRLRLGSLTEDGLSYKERFIVRCYEVGVNKTATVETIAKLLQLQLFLMPKRKAKRATKQSNSCHTQCDLATNGAPEENAFIDQEVDCQSAAIRVIRDMEIERLLTALSLLKSNMSMEQLQTPLLQFFEENLPNLTVSTSKKDGRIVVKSKDKDCDLSIKTVDGGNTISSFLQHMSTVMPSFGGFEFSSRPGKTSFIGAENLQIKDFVIEEPSDTHVLGIEDYLQTPVVTSQRLSVGMTPKTLRVPKQGEMLVSVHGSPLGVYKENNMDAIHEIEEE